MCYSGMYVLFSIQVLKELDKYYLVVLSYSVFNYGEVYLLKKNKTKQITPNSFIGEPIHTHVLIHVHPYIN